MHVPDDDDVLLINCCFIIHQGAALDSGTSGTESVDEGNRPTVADAPS